MSHLVATANTSATWTFFEGAWHEGNVAIMGPRTQGAWLASVVFDGGRAFEGVTPDLDQHCARINESARAFKLNPLVSDEEWLALAKDGVNKFRKDAALYVRPMYWADAGVGGGVKFDPGTTKYCLCIYEAPMPEPVAEPEAKEETRETLIAAGVIMPKGRTRSDESQIEPPAKSTLIAGEVPGLERGNGLQRFDCKHLVACQAKFSLRYSDKGTKPPGKCVKDCPIFFATMATEKASKVFVPGLSRGHG